MNYSQQQITALKDLLYKIADDQLIIGHRNSEWTGLGPLLEEDIAFSSIAQDKLGQSLHLYEILHQLGEKDPDTIAFTRNVDKFKCCHFVEYPIGEYDFSLMRNFLFNHAEAARFSMLSGSSFEPLQNLAKKYRGEIKYHVMHADTWIKQLSRATEESCIRMQKALNECFNLALGIFEESDYVNLLHEMKIFEGENALKDKWLENISPVIKEASLNLPENKTRKPAFGGRKGHHTEHLQPLLDEMSVVFRLDPKAEW
ncbi:MAG TPA: 1,2-phenylacetyl-CoA epoxidase subunit PaaC [Ignavibacteria bacterium]|jgi:ring-1,2-phenylacetyl-CoA epoxidase subunit PaaC